MAFSSGIVTDLLRTALDFRGYVNSDTGIINTRAWGLEQKSVPERVAAAINAGVDMLSGFNVNRTITDLVTSGLISRARVDEAASRILREQFDLGLFENPYVDPGVAARTVGRADLRAKGLEVQRQSVVLLQNRGSGVDRLLPMRPDAHVYVIGDIRKGTLEAYGFSVTDGNPTANQRRPSAKGHDYAIISITALNPPVVTASYRSDDPTGAAKPSLINPITRKVFGADDPSGLDNGLIFGGAFPWEANALSFTAMSKARSWEVKPPLREIQQVMSEVGPDRTVLVIYFRQPFVIDEVSGMRRAGAILAHFSVSDTALVDVLTGRSAPRGKLPFALADNLQAVVDNESDVPGYPGKDTLYPFGFGLTY